MPKLPDIKHVFFDLDHTLWDFEVNSKKTYAFIFKTNNITVAIADFIKVYQPINHHYWKLYRQDKITQKALKYARLKDAFNALNIEITDDLIHLLAKQYLENLSNYNALFAGTIDLLNYLKPKYKLHIITNGFSEIQEQKMKNAGIFNFFEQIITSQFVAVKKPNPKIFFYALKKAKAYTYQSVMIGDNIEADIFGALNIGMTSILCNFDNKTAPKKIDTVTSLSQIKQYL